MNRFKVIDLQLHGLKVLERKPFEDNRGFFSRLFCETELANVGWYKPIVQINLSSTYHKGTLRGMHYQKPPHAEIRLITSLRGESWHVAVDLRKESPTFMNWHGEILSAKNNRAFLIPEGYAHGFQTLTNDVLIVYCHSKAHHPDAEAVINATDPRLSIPWPLEITERSIRDINQPMIDSKFKGLIF